jgi:phosphoribosylglycinamide formyltransferase-1
MTQKRKIVLFASGSGSNAENIINFFSGCSEITFPFILSNKKDAFVHERAQKLGIPSFTFSKEDLLTGTLLSFLKKENIDFIILAGFLLRIPEDFLAAYPNKIINIHPSLLPKYGGKGMYGMKVHEAVVANKEKESGITIHFLNEKYDEGAIIFQGKCDVLPTDTPDDVARKVHALEYEHYPRVVESLIKKGI